MLFSLRQGAKKDFCQELKKNIESYEYKDIVIVNIGTDRSTGDSLGPLVGYKLSKMLDSKKIHIYGTLDKPVHAKNLNRLYDVLSSNHEESLVIVVDACIGSGKKQVGCIYIENSPTKPGTGTGKYFLDEIGDISILGILSQCSGVDSINDIRLSLVMKQADFISECIAATIKEVI